MYCENKVFGVLTILSFFSVILMVGTTRISRQDSATRRCTLPQHPINGRWSNIDSKSSPGQKVSSGTIISVTCNGQYKLNSSSVIKCEKYGNWGANIGECLELCPPILSTFSTRVTCTADGEASHDCGNVINGTVATFKCAPFYENSEINRNPFRFCRDGAWSQEIPKCQPICGVKPTASEMRKAYFPWNVAIFKIQENEKWFQCAGTLINERVILTAANCIADEFGKPFPTTDFSVVAGKSSNQYSDDRDPEAQYSDLEAMFVSDIFKGKTRRYSGDIAVIITKDSFNMSRRIQPACLDWSNKFSKQFKYPKITGSIAGPLKTRFYPQLAEVTEIAIPFVNDTQCYDQLKRTSLNGPDFQAFFTFDKYCAGYINSDRVPMCRMDKGVGLVSKNPFDNKYYLTGVLNTFPSLHRENCDNKRWALFTQVSTYMSGLIIEKNDMYTTIDRSYFQTSCGTKSVQAKILVVNGKNVTRGDYPWQVAIYKIQGSRRTLICGGTLINPRVILTAAHCVTGSRGNKLPKELFTVAVGKYFRNFDDPRDAEAQFSTLKDIFVPNQYQGDLQNYLGDIAILITENSFVFSKAVEPVCVDWERRYETQFLRPSVTGFVTGWGFTSENSKPSQELKELEVPYVEREECREKLPNDYEIYLTTDKMCSGFLNKSRAVCSGDSGGGLVFKNINDGKYYIAGIVSLSPQAPTGGCDSQQYALYTKVSEYIENFIMEKARLFWA